MKKKMFALIAVVALAAPAVSMAQLGGLLGGKAAGSSGGDLAGQQDALVRNYVAAGKDVLTANDHLADALGIKAQAVNEAATSDSLAAKDVEAQDIAISKSAAAVSEALKGNAQLKDGEA